MTAATELRLVLKGAGYQGPYSNGVSPRTELKAIIKKIKENSAWPEDCSFGKVAQEENEITSCTAQVPNTYLVAVMQILLDQGFSPQKDKQKTWQISLTEVIERAFEKFEHSY